MNTSTSGISFSFFFENSEKSIHKFSQLIRRRSQGEFEMPGDLRLVETCHGKKVESPPAPRLDDTNWTKFPVPNFQIV